MVSLKGNKKLCSLIKYHFKKIIPLLKTETSDLFSDEKEEWYPNYILIYELNDRWMFIFQKNNKEITLRGIKYYFKDIFGLEGDEINKILEQLIIKYIGYPKDTDFDKK